MDEQNDITEQVRSEIEKLASTMMAQGVGHTLCTKMAAHQIREAAALDAAKLQKRHGQLAKSKQNEDKQAEALVVSGEIDKFRKRYQAALAEWLRATTKIDSSLKALLADPVSQNQVTMPSEVLGVRQRDPSDSPSPKDPSSSISDEDATQAIRPEQPQPTIAQE